MRILIIDPDPIYVATLSEILQKAGHVCCIHPTPTDATGDLPGGEIDCVIAGLSIRLGSDGDDIRALCARAGAPLIFVSHDGESDVFRLYIGGDTPALEGRFCRESLESALLWLLRHKRQPAVSA